MTTLPFVYDTQSIARILALAFMGFSVSMLITPIYTTLAYGLRWWKKHEPMVAGVDGPSGNGEKESSNHNRIVPTMAGVIAVIAVSSATLAFNLVREQTWLPVAAMLGAGAAGLFTDIVNLRGIKGGVSRSRSKLKLLLITIVALIGGLWFHYKLDGYDILHVTFLGDFNLGLWIVPLFVFVVIATVSAVDRADGVDGLAGGLLATAFGTFGIIAYLEQRYAVAGFCATMVGAILSYVWFNIYPARFIMGEAGSFAFGTALAVVAALTGTLVLLPVVGLVFVGEAGSGMLQALLKRLRNSEGIFPAVPIHRYFEDMGWPATKVAMRLWVIGQVAAVLGLILFMTGGHI